MENISHRSGGYLFIVIIAILIMTIIYMDVVNEKKNRTYNPNLRVTCSTNLSNSQVINHREMLSTLNQYHNDDVFCTVTYHAKFNTTTEQQ